MEKRKIADWMILTGFVLIIIGLALGMKNQDKKDDLKFVRAVAKPSVKTETKVLGESIKSELINLNTASLAELDNLPGIGPVIGQRIIDYRIANNGFKDIKETQMVKGIGEKMFAKIVDKIEI